MNSREPKICFVALVIKVVTEEMSICKKSHDVIICIVILAHFIKKSDTFRTGDEHREP